MRKILTLIVLSILLFGCSAPQENKEIKDYSNARVSYLGPSGTYTEEACEHFFENKGTYIPYQTVNEVVDALIANETDYAVIPQENTIGGAVIDYVDLIIEKKELAVVGEVELIIKQNLLAIKDATLSDIKTVYSHSQGLSQGKDWLNENLPNVELITVSSTAEAARLVKEENDISKAAIASLKSSEVYDLKILAESIQNNDSNKTRFYVLSKEEPSTLNYDRLAFIASGKAEELPDLMSRIDDLKMKLITIHDRPLKSELGEYYYIIECVSNYSQYEKLIRNSSFAFRYLGSFDLR